MKLSVLLNRYAEAKEKHENARQRIFDKMGKLEDKIKKLDQELLYLDSNPPCWSKDVITPIAEELLKTAYPGWWYILLGPSGFNCRITVNFHKKTFLYDKEKEDCDIRTITFQPGGNPRGKELWVVDYKTNTHKPVERVSEEAEVSTLKRWMEVKEN